MIYSPTFFGIMILSAVLGAITQAWVNGSFRRWSRIGLATGLSGAETARNMLDASGLTQVSVEMVGGNLTDHFDPRAGVLRLSRPVYEGRTVAAAGVACHEAGHAVQHAAGYAPARFRMALVPSANIGSKMAFPLILIGLVLNFTELAWVGVAMFGAAVLFQLVTLPVEFDASRRALAALSGGGMVPAEQVGGAREVLTAAAMTYLAAALISVLQLLYFAGMARRD